jgi:hypothetical protein
LTISFYTSDDILCIMTHHSLFHEDIQKQMFFPIYQNLDNI